VAVPEALGAGLLVVLLTAVACLGVRESVGLAAAFTLVEIAGLLVVIALGVMLILRDPVDDAALVPTAANLWPGIPAGIFLAFFAFVGFENLVNMAEEVRDVGRTLPRAILLSIGIAAALYGAVGLVAVLAVPASALAASTAPLCLIVEAAGFPCERAFSALALAAISNGVLIDILMVARLVYGMARRGWLP